MWGGNNECTSCCLSMHVEIASGVVEEPWKHIAQPDRAHILLVCIHADLSLRRSAEVWADGCVGCQAAGAEDYRKPALAQGCSNPV